MFNNCFNLQSHDRKGVVTIIEYQASKTCKSCQNPARTCPEQRRRTNSPINFLNRARKNNIFLQNEPNSPSVQVDISACNISGSGNFRLLFPRKNKAKQSQNEPNFGPKLALFFPKLASFFPNRICKNGVDNRNVTERRLCGRDTFCRFRFFELSEFLWSLGLAAGRLVVSLRFLLGLCPYEGSTYIHLWPAGVCFSFRGAGCREKRCRQDNPVCLRFRVPRMSRARFARFHRILRQ